jgi:hypothetical protein
MVELSEPTPRWGWQVVAALVCAVFSAWIAVPFVVFHEFSDWQKSGQFGDTFGAANALFTGLAFAFLIVSVRLQSNELALQRKELQLQREEMRASREALSAQADAQTLQLHAAIAQLFPSARASFGGDIRKVGEEMRKRAENLQALANRTMHGSTERATN